MLKKIHSPNFLFVSMYMYFAMIISVNQIKAQIPTVWHFGQKAGIVFTQSGTANYISNSQMSTPEGCSSFDLSTGNPMIYTNGEKIWNASGQIIPNGSNLNGSIYSCQSSLIYAPSMSDSIYVFTTDKYNGNNGLCYSTLKRSTNLIVSEKNKSLLSSATERLTITPHCDKKSMWLLTHQWNTNAFYSYKIADTALVGIPIVSNVGSVHNGNRLNAKGCMKVSRSGDKLAVAKMYDGVVELFHFDNISGQLSDPILISGIPNAYGVEFDGLGNVLYVSSASGQLFQFDVSVWNASTIINSKTVISNQAQLIGSLEFGPDGKIYVSIDNSLYLARIEYPMILGVSCNLNTNAIYLGGKKCEAGLPQTYAKSLNYSFNTNKVCIGDTTFFTYNCDSNMVDSIKYYFSKNPILDSSRFFNPKFVYPAAGIYYPKMIVYHCNSADTASRPVEVMEPPVVNLGPDTSFCSGDLPDIYAGPQSDIYLWDDSSTLNTRHIDSTGLYWVKASNICGYDIDSINILNIYQNPVIQLPKDTSICINDSIILDAGDDTTIINIWQGYLESRYYIAKNNGSYFLDRIDTNNCKSSASFDLQIVFPPQIDLGNDTSICIGKSLTFNGQADGDYLWQNNSTDTSLTVNKAGLYILKVENKCGSDIDSCRVSIDNCNQVIWVPNSFTPNNDGINDVFLPYIENVRKYSLSIYNKWGQLIFNTSEPYLGWDGRYNGKISPEDSYIWKISYENYSGDSFIKHGFVILYR